jgi:hypothetical protein
MEILEGIQRPEETIMWIANPLHFAFEDGIMDLSKNQLITPQPSQFINLTCGYKWNESFSPADIEKAEQYILSFDITEDQERISSKKIFCIASFHLTNTNLIWIAIIKHKTLKTYRSSIHSNKSHKDTA